MSDLMQFPEKWEEFETNYGFTDSEEIYTNGARLIPSFRVEQWLEHINRKPGKWIYLDGLDVFECSVCGRQMVRNIFYYCPWCGARMDGKEQERSEEWMI